MKTRHDQLNGIIDTATQVHRSSLRLFRLLRATRPANGLSSSKLSVLGFLYQGGEGTATELASYLRIQPQSLTRLISDLERSKLITRRTNDADRRQSLLEITEVGAQVADRRDARTAGDALANHGKRTDSRRTGPAPNIRRPDGPSRRGNRDADCLCPSRKEKANMNAQGYGAVMAISRVRPARRMVSPSLGRVVMPV